MKYLIITFGCLISMAMYSQNISIHTPFGTVCLGMSTTNFLSAIGNKANVKAINSWYGDTIQIQMNGLTAECISSVMGKSNFPNANIITKIEITSSDHILFNSTKVGDTLHSELKKELTKLSLIHFIKVYLPKDHNKPDMLNWIPYTTTSYWPEAIIHYYLSSNIFSLGKIEKIELEITYGEY
jgi:hypothetical protein